MQPGKKDPLLARYTLTAAKKNHSRMPLTSGGPVSLYFI